MSGAFLLFRLSLKRVWPLLCGTGLLLAAVQALRVRIAASLHNAGQFNQLTALLPPDVHPLLGPSLASIMTFNGIVCGLYFDTGYIIALLALAIALATLPASEIETGFADLILALSLGMLVVCWSGVAMAFGAAYRRGVASATTSLLAFGALLLDWAHRLWPALDCIAWLSPFCYFNPYELVAGSPLRLENLLVLWAMAMTGFTLAYFIISQRNISR